MGKNFLTTYDVREITFLESTLLTMDGRTDAYRQSISQNDLQHSTMWPNIDFDLKMRIVTLAHYDWFPIVILFKLMSHSTVFYFQRLEDATNCIAPMSWTDRYLPTDHTPWSRNEVNTHGLVVPKYKLYQRPLRLTQHNWCGLILSILKFLNTYFSWSQSLLS